MLVVVGVALGYRRDAGVTGAVAALALVVVFSFGFVDVNPISTLATASRSLMDGNPDGVAIGISLAVAAAPAAVFLPITTRLYRSR